jgi:hypothetical protein
MIFVNDERDAGVNGRNGAFEVENFTVFDERPRTCAEGGVISYVRTDKVAVCVFGLLIGVECDVTFPRTGFFVVGSPKIVGILGEVEEVRLVNAISIFLDVSCGCDYSYCCENKNNCKENGE